MSRLYSSSTILYYRRRKNLVVGFLYAAYILGEKIELILTVKTETRHLVEGYFGSKFRAICNHCGILMAGVARPKILLTIFAFVGIRTPYGKIFKNSVKKIFTASPIDVVEFKFSEMLPTGNR